MRDIAIIDCQISGISGDMLLSALVHAGAQEKKILQAVFACQDFLIGQTKLYLQISKKRPSTDLMPRGSRLNMMKRKEQGRE